MAHECPECGYSCHCNGDICDVFLGDDPNCQCAYSEWGCGKYDDEDFDEDEYYYEMDRLNDITPDINHPH